MTSKSRENGKKFIELLDKRQNLEGTKVVNILLNLSNSNYTVARNYQELTKIIVTYEKNLSIWDVKNRPKLDSLMREFSRCLHNYLSSVYSLIQHTFIVKSNLDRIKTCEEFTKKVRILSDNSCITFVKDLRTYSQHIKLPIISSSISISKNKTNGKNIVKKKILLQKQDILQWTNWSKSSKDYINSKKELEFKNILSEYEKLNREFFNWFYNEATKLYSPELEEYANLEKELSRLAP